MLFAPLSSLLLSLLFLSHGLVAAPFSSQLSGRILLDVEQNGEAWYVYPPTGERYFMGRPSDAFEIMSDLGLGISNADLERIPVSTSAAAGDQVLRSQLSGRVLLQVEENGEAWYVYPGNQRRYFLGRPSDAFAIMSGLGLGISSVNLAKISVAGNSLDVPDDTAHSYRAFTLTNERGSFPLRVVTLDRDQVEMVTDTADTTDCQDDCAALSLQQYVNEHGALAGIHGSYFCPPDYAPCADKINTYLPPVFNTNLNRLINEEGLRFFSRPMIAAAEDGRLFYFHRATAFGNTVEDFEDEYDVELQAAIGNWPSLVENGQSVAASEPTEQSFTLKATRGGIGWNDEKIFLVIAQSASIVDLASVFVDLGAEFALNLDGGGTSALYYDGAYRFGPGRQLPNAILFRQR